MADTVKTDKSSPLERPPPKKRRRIAVSCTECHRRKQKCDRELPCTNCRYRNREPFCSYAPGAPRARESKASLAKPSPSSAGESPVRNDEPLSSLATAWGYGQTGASTIDFLKKIEMAQTAEDEEGSVARLPPCGPPHDTPALRERYKGLIRQLPSRSFIDRLVDIFMKEYNWQYYFVDPDIFDRQLEEWNALPFSIFSSDGPHGIPPDLRVFPAVLFQVVAAALLVVPEELAEEFAALKYAANMTYEDLACDYSESGASIVSLLGKTGLSVTTVQAEFLRASFLKFTAGVTESWHMVAIAIRDAQELGMHRDSLDPKPASPKVEDVLQNQWSIERRRKMYMVLALWDINMCIVLGRPGAIDWRHGLPSLPIDAPAPSNRSKTPVVARDTDRDPPTPLTRALWLHTLTGPLREIQDLEQEGSYPKSFSKVDRLQQTIMALNETKPAIFRLENPDIRWDSHPDVQWIHPTRYYMETMHQFSLMALHRPYVLHRKKSRREALKAGFALLESQRRMFEGSPRESWRNFMLFYGAFDAIVLIASIYIIFPQEQEESRHCSVKHVQWAIERFAAMESRNPLAKSAQGVLQAILAKMNRATAIRGPERREAVVRDGAGADTLSSTMARDASETMTLYPAGGAADKDTISSAAAAVAETEPGWHPAVEWDFEPPSESLASIAPTFALSDLLFNDLQAAYGSTTEDESVTMMNPAVSVLDGPTWQFGGEVGDGTLWQFLNQFPMRE